MKIMHKTLLQTHKLKIKSQNMHADFHFFWFTSVCFFSNISVVFLKTLKFFSCEETWKLLSVKQEVIPNRLSLCGNSSVEAIGPVSSTAQWAVAAITIATIATAIVTAIATAIATA
jgi:hypothetical protein